MKSLYVSNKRNVVLFLIVGLLTAFLYYFIFTLMWRIFLFSYSIAIAVAYPAAVTFHFLMNRNLTFKSRFEGLKKQVWKYLLVTGFNYILTMAIVEWAVKVLGVTPYLGMLFGIGITVIAGYLMLKLWVFRVRLL